MPKKPYVNKEIYTFPKGVDAKKFAQSIRDTFADFPDPRRKKQTLYPIWYLFLMIFSGYLSGCNTISDITGFALLRAAWFSELLGEKYPAPSYDTFWWFLVRIKPEVFKKLMKKWLYKIPQEMCDQLLVIDGKRIRGASQFNEIFHLVELYASDKGLVIAQERVPKKKAS